MRLAEGDGLGRAGLSEAQRELNAAASPRGRSLQQPSRGHGRAGRCGVEPPPALHRRLLLLLLLIAISVFLTTEAGAEGSAPKKLIYYGWGVRDTQYVRQHWREMEQAPFDGTGVAVAVDRQAWQKGDRSTGNQLGWQVMGNRAFQREQFREAVADLQSAKWRSFTDNFLPVAISSSVSAHGLSWFDDDRWRIIASNFALLGEIAAEVGAKGIILDPEHYGYQLFNFSSHRQQVDRPFAEFVEIARKRGRQVMGALGRKLPNAVVLSLFGYTLALSELRPGRGLEVARYGLLAAFLDGVLEAMPPGSQFVDGYESAYGFRTKEQFVVAYRQIHDKGVALSDVPRLYRARVRAGFGLWLDYRRQTDYRTPEELSLALSSALEVSDQYVWIYSVGPRFFPPSGIEPAYIQAIERARQRACRKEEACGY